MSNEERALERVNVLLGGMERIRKIAETVPEPQKRALLTEIYFACNQALAIQPKQSWVSRFLRGFAWAVR